MKSDLTKFMLILIIGVFAGLFVGKSCQEDPNKAILDMMDKHRQTILDSLIANREFYVARADSGNLERTIIKNYYNETYYKIDSLYNLDSLLIRAIVRFWADSASKVLEIKPDWKGEW